MKTKKKSIQQSAFSKQAALEPETTSVDGSLYRVLRPAFQKLLIFIGIYIQRRQILRIQSTMSPSGAEQKVTS
jgi:hypothetical protein